MINNSTKHLGPARARCVSERVCSSITKSARFKHYSPTIGVKDINVFRETTICFMPIKQDFFKPRFQSLFAQQSVLLVHLHWYIN